MKVLVVTGPNVQRVDLKYIYDICDVTNIPERAGIILAVGGDSAMLSAIHEYKDLNVPFIGMNYGHVGFLLNDVRPENGPDFEEFVRSAALVNLWMVEAKIEYADGTAEDLLAFNDVYMSPLEGQMLKMNLSVNGEKIPEIIAGDGFIVSTPQGSTGYNRAAKGKIIKPGSPILQLTPKFCTIGAQRVLLDSFIEPDDTVFRIDFIDAQYRRANVFFDGKMIKTDKILRGITFKKSLVTVDLLFGEEFNFYEKIYRLQYHV